MPLRYTPHRVFSDVGSAEFFAPTGGKFPRTGESSSVFVPALENAGRGCRSVPCNFTIVVAEISRGFTKGGIDRARAAAV